MRSAHDNAGTWPPGPNLPWMATTGVVTPPPSAFYPFAAQASLSTAEGMVITGPDFFGSPLLGGKASPDSVLTLLKTVNAPLTHGDLVQFQCRPDNPEQGGQLWYTSGYTNEDGDGNASNVPYNYPLLFWPYLFGVTTDPRSVFSIYRADGNNEAIVGPTDVRIVTSTGALLRGAPFTTIGGWRNLCGDGLIDDDVIFTIVTLP